MYGALPVMALALLLGSTFAAVAGSAGSPAPPFRFVADVSQTATVVSRTFVGATLEDTSLSLYGGGLYSQLIYGESFEEPRLEGVAGSPAGTHAHNSPAGFATWASSVKSPCHTLIPGRSKASADAAFNGKQSLRLNGPCQITNMGGGGDRWGISLTAGHTFDGYLFSRGSATLTVGLCPAASSDSGATPATSYYASQVLAAPKQPSLKGGWHKRAFSLTPHTADSTGSFSIRASDGSVDIDSVFLEDTANLYPGAQHVRRDLAEATLLNGSFQFLRFGGDMAGRSTYSWHKMRGPAWLRPPQTPGSWSPRSPRTVLAC